MKWGESRLRGLGGDEGKDGGDGGGGQRGSKARGGGESGSGRMMIRMERRDLEKQGGRQGMVW